MNSGGGTTSTTQTSNPWPGAQPYLLNLMQNAQNTYNAEQGNTYMPPSYVGPSSTTQNALSSIVQRAQNGSPLINQADQSITNIMNPQQAPGTNTLNGLLSGYNDPGTAYTAAAAGPNAASIGAYGAAGNLAQMGTSGPNVGGSETTLSSLANSQIPGAATVNPYLDQMFSAESKPVIDAVNAQAGLAGRTGSGANQQLLTTNLGQLAAQVYGNNYAQEQQIAQNQQNLNQNAASAAGNLGLNAYNAQAGANQSAGSLLNTIGQNQAQNLLSAGSQLSNAAANQAQVQGNAANSLNSLFNTQNQQALQADSVGAPTLAGQDYTDLQNMLTAGQNYDQQIQNAQNSILSQWQYAQQQPWNILSGYAGAISGLGGLGGSSSGTSTQPSQSAVPGLIGTGISMLPFFL